MGKLGHDSATDLKVPTPVVALHGKQIVEAACGAHDDSERRRRTVRLLHMQISPTAEHCCVALQPFLSALTDRLPLRPLPLPQLVGMGRSFGAHLLQCAFDSAAQRARRRWPLCSRLGELLRRLLISRWRTVGFVLPRTRAFISAERCLRSVLWRRSSTLTYCQGPRARREGDS